jgi:hypothetical protein
MTQFVLLSALSTGAWRSVTELAERFALERTSLDPQSPASRRGSTDRTGRVQGPRLGLCRHRQGQGGDRGRHSFWRAAQERIEGGLGKERWSETRDGLKALRRVARRAD